MTRQEQITEVMNLIANVVRNKDARRTVAASIINSPDGGTTIHYRFDRCGTTIAEDVKEMKEAYKIMGYKVVTIVSNNERAEHFISARGERETKGGTKSKEIAFVKA